jgi:ADP-ribosyl-[dinitrogen reductase] hydrolase
MNKQATLLGLAIGDALGQPFEFRSSDMIIQSCWDGTFEWRSYDQAKINQMWGLSPGQWTDDTKMALCIANSLIEKQGFDVDDLAQKYIEWVESRDLRGIGTRTTRSIEALKRGVSPLESGKKETARRAPSFKRKSADPTETETGELHGIGDFCGCGTVMRAAPFGVFYRNNLDKMVEACKLDANITHNHADARDSSIFLCLVISNLLNGLSVDDAVAEAMKYPYEYDHVVRLNHEAIDMAKANTNFTDGISLGVAGTAHETLASALYCFLKFRSFDDAVASCVLLGGDTDSRAAIAGAMAGAAYGRDAIKKDWVTQVEDSEKLQQLDDTLYSFELDRLLSEG